MTQSRFACLVEAELLIARSKHAKLNSAHEAYSVLLEELEEFKVEVFKKRQQRNSAMMLEELYQLGGALAHRAEDLGLILAGDTGPACAHQLSIAGDLDYVKGGDA